MNPILFYIGDFHVAWYGALTMAGLVTGGMVALWLGKRDGIPDIAILDLLLMIVIGMVIGARGLYIIVEWDEFSQDPAGLFFSRSGFVFLGGLIGSTTACAYYMLRTKLPFWRVADVFAPAVPLGHAFGRIGCHMTGCCFGGVCSPDAFYAIQVEPTIGRHGDILGGWAAIEHAKMGLVPPGGPSLPMYPIQLFEAGALFLLAGALFWLKVKRPGWVGRTFLAYLMAYAVIRFGLEFLRGDAERGVYNLGFAELSASQLLGSAIFAAAAVAWWFGRRGQLPGQQTPLPEFLDEEPPVLEEAPAPAPKNGSRRSERKTTLSKTNGAEKESGRNAGRKKASAKKARSGSR
jgi:phosphatidylglycerol:prolipoprotein diacylglycerol transferase